MAFTFKPKTPPTFDFSALVKAINETRAKVNLPPITSGGPLWKRYVGSEGPEFDAAEEGGLRAVLKANAIATDSLKDDVDLNKQAIADLRAAVRVLQEAPAARPFP